jgi:hypothetical protein
MASNLSNALYVVRRRYKPLGFGHRIGQRFTVRHAVVADRVREIARVPKPLRFFDEPPWYPPEGRESPREEWMYWRKFLNRYAYPGFVGLKRRLISLDARRGYSRSPPLYSLRRP